MIMINVRDKKSGKIGLLYEIDFFNEMAYVEDIGWKELKEIELIEEEY